MYRQVSYERACSSIMELRFSKTSSGIYLKRYATYLRQIKSENVPASQSVLASIQTQRQIRCGALASFTRASAHLEQNVDKLRPHHLQTDFMNSEK